MDGEPDRPWLQAGAEVEFQSTADPGLRSAWFPGRLLDLDYEKMRAKVRYDRFFYRDDDAEGQEEVVHLAPAAPELYDADGRPVLPPGPRPPPKRARAADRPAVSAARPKPPQNAIEQWGPEKWQVGEWVEIDERECWWEGIITELSATAPLVLYPNFLNYGECTIEISKLRPLYEWVESYKIWKPRPPMAAEEVDALLRQVTHAQKSRGKNGRKR